MALHLGLTYGDGPGWFHSLPRQEQINVMAYHRITTEPPKKRGARLRDTVKASSSGESFWMGT
jgi:hypothetical protein